LEQLSGSAPSVNSTVERAILLNRLLDYLNQNDPTAAKALGSALPAFEALVMGLVQAQAQNGGSMIGTAITGSYALAVIGGPSLVPGNQVLGLAHVASFSDVISSGTVVQSAGLNRNQSIGSAMHKRSGLGTHVAPPASAPVPPLPALFSGGGASAAGGGGIGSAAPAIALLAALIVWALNFFSGRIDLDFAPWRTTLLASRLERPG
jgi:hypothetical protein